MTPRLEAFKALLIGSTLNKRTMTLKELNEKARNPRLVARYFVIYKNYLMNHNLDDDSKTISTKSLIQFVEDLDQEEEWDEHLNYIHL